MRSVVIIDDQASIRSFIEAVLGELYSVASFATISEFKTAFEKGLACDLVLTDLNLEQEDGRDVLAYMASHQIPVIVTTGELDLEIESELLELGAFDYIRKPLHQEILKHRVGL